MSAEKALLNCMVCETYSCVCATHTFTYLTSYAEDRLVWYSIAYWRYSSCCRHTTEAALVHMFIEHFYVHTIRLRMCEPPIN